MRILIEGDLESQPPSRFWSLVLCHTIMASEETVLFVSSQGPFHVILPKGSVYFCTIGFPACLVLCIQKRSGKGFRGLTGLPERAMAQKGEIWGSKEYSHMKTFGESRHFHTNSKCWLQTFWLSCYFFTCSPVVLQGPFHLARTLGLAPFAGQNLKPWDRWPQLLGFSQECWEPNEVHTEAKSSSPGSDFRIISAFAAAFVHQAWRFFPKRLGLGKSSQPLAKH